MDKNFFTRKSVIISGIVLIFVLSIVIGLFLGMRADRNIGNKVVIYPSHIRIMQYNINHGLNPQQKLNLKEVKTLVKQEKPDIICVNQIDKATPKSGYINEPGKLNESLGMNYSFGKAAPVQDGWTGNAIYSRFPIEFAQNVLFKQQNDDQNAFLYLILAYKGMELHVLTTSLKQQNYQVRLRELEEFIKKREISDNPIIIAGTFHTNENDREFQKFCKHYKTVFSKADTTATLTDSQPQKKVDYLMFSRNIELMEGKVIKSDFTNNISQHLPIMANINIK